MLLIEMNFLQLFPLVLVATCISFPWTLIEEKGRISMQEIFARKSTRMKRLDCIAIGKY
jgi:hypothetical protein